MEGGAAVERQPPPSSALRALVLDFDSTISQPVYLERHNAWACADRRALFADMRDDEILANFGGEARVRHLDAMLSQLRARGVVLFIVSIGFRDAFAPHLRKVNLLGHFDDRCIYGQDSPELREVAFVKGRLIDSIMRSNGWSHDEVLFVDDSAEHIQRAAAVCRTLHVVERKGMRADVEMRACLAAAGVACELAPIGGPSRRRAHDSLYSV